jgi:hypothetical protein
LLEDQAKGVPIILIGFFAENGALVHGLRSHRALKARDAHQKNTDEVRR